MKRPVLFIGYDPSLRDEISEFLKDRQGEAYFSDTSEETLRIMHTGEIETVVLNLQRLEDAAILRYINLHYQKTRVLIMPGQQLKDAIPAIASGRYEILNEPFRLAELRELL